jgi:acetyl esterase/lipase
MVGGQGAMQIPGPDMRVTDVPDARVRVYQPESSAPLPVIVALHGGGFVAGNLETLDPTCRRLATNIGAVVVNVDYRLAPEHPFPAAVNDTVDAISWVRNNIATFNGDASRIVLLGESAGGNLAAVASRKAGEAGTPVSAQVLLYPVVDGEVDTPSKREFMHGPFLSVAAANRFWADYIQGAEVTGDAAPLRASNLGDSPQTLVITMGTDPLRDEGELYVAKLRDAGVDVEHERFEGLMHATYTFSKMIPAAQGIHELIVEYLARALKAK